MTYSTFYFFQAEEQKPKELPVIPAAFVDKLFPEECNDISTAGFNLSDVENEYYHEHVIVNKDQATQICNLTMNQSKTQAWYSARAPRITASCAHKIWRARNSQNRLKYFLDTNSSDSLENFKYGHENEPKAVEKYEEVTGYKVEKSGLVIKLGKSFLAASPDGLVIDENGDLIILEVKCPISCKDSIIFTGYTSWNPKAKAYELEKTHPYFTQVQLQLYCCGAKRAHFFVFSSVSYRLITVNYDEEYVQNVIKKLEHYYFTEFLQHLSK